MLQYTNSLSTSALNIGTHLPHNFLATIIHIWYIISMTRIIIGGGLGGGLGSGLGGGLVGLLVAFASLILSLVPHHGWHLLWCDAFFIMAVDR